MEIHESNKILTVVLLHLTHRRKNFSSGTVLAQARRTNLSAAIKLMAVASNSELKLILYTIHVFASNTHRDD